MSNSEKMYLWFLGLLLSIYAAYTFFTYRRQSQQIAQVDNFDVDAWERKLRKKELMVNIAFVISGAVSIAMLVIGFHFSIKFW